MDITPQLTEGAPLISRYGGGGFVVGEQRHEGNLLVSALGVFPLEGITAQALAVLLDSEQPPELILLGTGVQMQPLSADIKHALDQRQIAYDMMDTGAACRTFNILLAEQRRVAALLIAV